MLVSHADFDHSAGNASVREAAPHARFMCHDLDRVMVEDIERLIWDRYGEFIADHGIDDGDVYAVSDGLTGGVPHPGDFYSFVPVCIDGEVVAWAIGINHLMENGAPVAGSWATFSVDTFMDGLVCPPMRTGRKLKQESWWKAIW